MGLAGNEIGEISKIPVWLSELLVEGQYWVEDRHQDFALEGKWKEISEVRLTIWVGLELRLSLKLWASFR